MNWKDIGHKVADSAPFIGRALALPGGELVGEMISHTLGTPPEPDMVMEAIQNNPEAITKIKELELTHEVEIKRLVFEGEANRLAAETKQIQTVNETMRAEAQSPNKWTSFWRPFWGMTSAVAFFITVCAICFLIVTAFRSKNLVLLSQIPQIITAVAILFGIPGAILGVAAHHRGKMQRIKAGEVPGEGLLSSIASRIKGPKR